MSNPNQPKTLSWKKISLLAISVVFIVLGNAIVTGLISSLYISNIINANLFVELLKNAFAFSWLIRGIGIFLLCFVGYTTHFKVNYSLLRRQFMKTPLLIAVIVGLLCFATIAEAPIVSAEKMNTMTQGWKICSSFGLYDWWIGQLSDNSYFAMRGSDGNVMTFVEPWQNPAPWAAYANNLANLETQVLATITSGTVYCKDVLFDYSLTVPDNVRVIEDANGLRREFISSQDSQGSPYTISVDTVNPTYYLAQDCAGRFIDTWSSTNGATVANNALTAMKTTGGKLIIQGHLAITTPLIIVVGSEQISIEGTNWAIQGGGALGYGSYIDSTQNIDLIQISGSTSSVTSGISISNIGLSGSGKTNGHCGINATRCDQLQVHNVGIYNVEYGIKGYRMDTPHFYANTVLISGYGIFLDDVSNAKIFSNAFGDLDYDAITITSSYSLSYGNEIYGNNAGRVREAIVLVYGAANVIDTAITGNNIHQTTRNGINIYLSAYNTITGNTFDACGTSAANTYSGIFLNQSGANAIGSNTFTNSLSNTMKYAICESGVDYTKNNTVTGNTIIAMLTAPVHRVTLLNTYRDNTGMVFENQGYWHMDDGTDTVVITHGLTDGETALNPAAIALTENADFGTLWYSGYDTTTITVKRSISTGAADGTWWAKGI